LTASRSLVLLSTLLFCMDAGGRRVREWYELAPGAHRLLLVLPSSHVVLFIRPCLAALRIEDALTHGTQTLRSRLHPALRLLGRRLFSASFPLFPSAPPSRPPAAPSFPSAFSVVSLTFLVHLKPEERPVEGEDEGKMRRGGGKLLRLEPAQPPGPILLDLLRERGLQGEQDAEGRSKPRWQDVFHLFSSTPTSFLRLPRDLRHRR
jgi:hypothetical protein